MGRLLTVANRLPVTAVTSATGAPGLEPSVGGLATGLSALHDDGQSQWIGWLGTTESPERAPELERELAARRLVAVDLTAEEVRQYYDGYSNGVLWPIFHYFIERLPLEIEGFEVYETVNQRFADAVAAI